MVFRTEGAGVTASWDASVFDRIHARDSDPWAVKTSDYERKKYAATLAALPRARFGYGLEIGCSIGVQTVLLAGRCDRLLAIDIAEEPVRRTRARCDGLAHVDVRQAGIPGDWPAGLFDLIVMSEMLYFLNRTDVLRTAELARNALAPDGAVLLVNWTGETDTPTTGDEAACLFAASVGLERSLFLTEKQYRLDRFGARGALRVSDY